MNYSVVVVAAGKGERMGAQMNKVLLPLQGVPIIVHTLRIFEQDDACSGIVLVVKEAEMPAFNQILSAYHLKRKVQIVSGGKERQDSVFQGLLALENSGETIVLIHDAARPCVPKEKISGVVQAAFRTGAAILAVRVKDTIKEATGHQVRKTLDRSSLWAAQKPQAFRLSAILEAHRTGRKQGLNVTDDASLVEQLGQTVAIVEGSYHNIKITTPEDMLIARQFIKGREETNAYRPRI
ncbi:2-C-methyl-D-erythritol 4-phosphate cytidylyltransferase [Terrilactibacillus sp. S3-3]|nr:2-C-methyl-D-erythritol 4-phosphate cytidylyltransferase [Terrilactibacillus sp. S3-3]